MNKRYFSSLIVLTILVGLLSAAWINRLYIYDYIRLWGYTPSSEVVELADSTTLYQNSRRLFYANQPVLAEKSAFNDFCREDEQTIVLGCYISGDGIYLLDVDDERLDGIKEVTAAHELLHAAYERLGSERSRIDDLINKTYNDLDNDRVKETVELYRKQDPSIVPNELHSIVGTEVRQLPQELEDYYARYFRDRSKIVTLSEQYEQAFTERRNQIRSFDKLLSELKIDIESVQSKLTQLNQTLQIQRADMERLRSSDRTDEYNSQVPIYNSRVNTYNQDLQKLQSLTIQHNDIVKKRNEIAIQEAELVEAIDSREAVPVR
ncbi:MAG: hypothetical protein M3Q36_02865 [bacterium]|nr:hypothetical protein [bacterium]